VSGLKDEKSIKKQTCTKTETCKLYSSILDYFEYFCQMSSKSIFIILSYTVSNFAHFWRHSVQQRVAGGCHGRRLKSIVSHQKSDC